MLLKTLRLPQLAAPVAPARHEILVSYLNRLATLHGLQYEELWKQISISRASGSPVHRRILIPERLAELTGRPHHHLSWAIPELRQPPPDWRIFRHEPQPACPGCTAKHQGGQVFAILPHHQYVCLKHQIWIGPPDVNPKQPNLHQLPEIVAAQRHHHRLMHRIGWAATYDAVLTGFMICGWVWDKQTNVVGYYNDEDAIYRTWTSRAQTLIPPGTSLHTFSASKVFAAVYPEAVSIAALIGSPHWRAMATGTTAQQWRLVTEISRRLRWTGYQPKVTYDAIAHWMDTDAKNPPSEPAKIFPETRGHALPSQLISSSQRSTNAQQRSSYWFDRNHKGGSVILHHRHIRPVLIREWSQQMAQFDGAIWASQTTSEAKPALWNQTQFLKPRADPGNYLPPQPGQPAESAN